MQPLDGQSRRTVPFALLIWLAATLLQAVVLAAQERLYFPYAWPVRPFISGCWEFSRFPSGRSARLCADGRTASLWP